MNPGSCAWTLRALVGEPEATMSEQQKSRFEAALGDYLSAQQFNAERPETNTTLASLYLERGELEQAKRFLSPP